MAKHAQPKQAALRLRVFATPEEFELLDAMEKFRTTEDEAYGIMLTAHQRGACVVAVFTREIAETKASEATDLGRRAGHPLTFTTEPEE